MTYNFAEMKDKLDKISKISGSYLKCIKFDDKEYWNID